VSAPFVQAVSELPEYFRAPLQADPQLAYLLKNQMIDAIFCDDSGILALYAADFLIKSSQSSEEAPHHHRFQLNSLVPTKG
jgi:hypothetical protein